MILCGLLRSLRPPGGAVARLIPAGIATVLAVLLVAAAAAPAAAQPFLKFSLETRVDSQAVPILLALDRGYLKAEGLDVTIDPATGAQEVLSRVASGTYDFGLVDINALIRWRDQNPGVAMPAVFVIYNRAPFAVLARRSREIAAPKDLDGKRIGASVADGSLANLRLFARLNEVDPSRLRVDAVALPVREPMLASGQVDAISATTFTAVDLAARGVPAADIVVLPMADYGVVLYGQAIVAGPRLVAERGDTVRAVLRGVLRGLRDTVADPARAIEAVARRIDPQQTARELERLRMAVRDNIVTAEVRENGFGAVDMERLARSIDQLALGQEFRTKPRPADVFDPAFLPPRSDRLPR
jgi:NitT/TauT family transport system substrate-binding protein